MQSDDQVTSRFDPDRIEVDMDRDKMMRSVQSPLYMLNIKQDDIPDMLPEAHTTYDEPTSCLIAMLEFERLSMLLGSDEAVQHVAEYENLTLDASDAIESAIGDFIPFESVIKYVSGATKHEKRVERAFFRGQIRRAYLKGYIDRNQCSVPSPEMKPGMLTADSSDISDDSRLVLVNGAYHDISVTPEPRLPADETPVAPLEDNPEDGDTVVPPHGDGTLPTRPGPEQHLSVRD